MNKLSKLVVAAVLALTSTSSFANWSNTTKITKVEHFGGIGIFLYGDFGNPSNCSANNAGMLWIPKSHADYEMIYSTAMSAYLSGIKVVAHTNGCSATGFYSGTFSTVFQSFRTES